jgi:hypothetical protein
MASGARAKLPSSAAGEIRIYCALHPWEDVTVLAAPSRWAALIGAVGDFRIEEVSEGIYDVVASDGDDVRAVATIRVREGATVELDLPVRDAAASNDP